MALTSAPIDALEASVANLRCATFAGSPALLPTSHLLYTTVMLGMGERWSSAARDEAVRQLAEDSTITFDWADAPFRMELADRGERYLLVCATVAENVDATPDLFEWLSESNAGIVTSRLFYDEGFVVAVAEMPLATAEPVVIEHLAWAVGSLAASVADLVIEEFGGDRYRHPSAIPWTPTD